MAKYKAPENDGGQGMRNSQNLFARRGNPWVTRKEADKEYQRAFNIARETRTLSRDEEGADDRCTLYENMMAEMAEHGHKPKAPRRPSREEITFHQVSGDPDIDRYTKAGKPAPRPVCPPPKPKEFTPDEIRSIAAKRKLAAMGYAMRKARRLG